MTRKRLSAGAAVIVAVALIVTAVVVVVSSADEASPAKSAQTIDTAKVTRGPLAAVVSLDGILTYRAQADGSPYSAVNRAKGTYTALPAEGDRIDCGDVLYRVNDRPVVLLCGSVPAYRDLRIGDTGEDVRQLNRNLHRLGYDAGPGLGDDDYTGQTASALRKLQRHEKVDVTGSLDLEDAVFLPRPVRIATVTAKLGAAAQPGSQIAQATSDTLDVQANLDASQQGEVKRGDRARITLPGNRSVAGRVSRIGRVAQTPENDDAKDPAAATIPAYIRIDHPAKARELDQAPVKVDVTTTGVRNALSVPVLAILGKSGGGYGVEVVRGGGHRELVAVRLGLFDSTGGRVQVQGGVHEGDRVVVPSP